MEEFMRVREDMGRDEISESLRGWDTHEQLHWGRYLLSLTKRKIKLPMEPQTCNGC